jgi:mevalonate kinase
MHCINKQYYSKILLIGEYSVLLNGPALTIPFRKFSGSLSNAGEESEAIRRQSQLELHDLGSYIQQCIYEGLLTEKFHYNKFVEDIDNGMIFQSDIPLSYGLGISGALTAAVYESYFEPVILPVADLLQPDWEKVKHTLSVIESHFHGRSSGMDPASCLVNKPLKLKSDESLSIAEIPGMGPGVTFFLVDTEINSKTGPLLKYFTERMEEQEFQRMVFKDLIPVTECLINNILAGEHSSLLRCFRELSSIQLQYFCPMIPIGYEGIWEDGLNNNLFYMKLCGSGGGGYLLGFTTDYKKTGKFFNKINKEIIPLETSTL